MRVNNAVAAPEQDAAELEQLERLVDIQRQIVELAERNAAMERHCLALRKAMADRFEHRQQQRHPALRRWIEIVRNRWRGDARPAPGISRVPWGLDSNSA